MSGLEPRGWSGDRLIGEAKIQIEDLKLFIKVPQLPLASFLLEKTKVGPRFWIIVFVFKSFLYFLTKN